MSRKNFGLALILFAQMVVPGASAETTGGFVGLHVDLEEAGVVVTDVVADSPAAQARFEPGDILSTIDGHRMEFEDRVKMIERLRSLFRVGDEISIEVLRGDQSLTLAVTPEHSPEATEAQDAWLEATTSGTCSPRRSHIDLGSEIGRNLVMGHERGRVTIRWEDDGSAVDPNQLPDHIIESARKQPIGEGGAWRYSKARITSSYGSGRWM